MNNLLSECYRLGVFVIVPQHVLLQNLGNQDKLIYLILGYAAYFIIMISPFIHEIIIKLKYEC